MLLLDKPYEVAECMDCGCWEHPDSQNVKINYCDDCESDCSYRIITINDSLNLEDDNWLNPNPNDPNQLKLFNEV